MMRSHSRKVTLIIQIFIAVTAVVLILMLAMGSLIQNSIS